MSRNRPKRGASFPALLLLLLGGVLLVGAALVLMRGGKGGSSPVVPVEVKGRPSLKVDREKINFGDVKLDKTVTATFTLSNVGDQPLRFTRQPFIEVAAGC